MVQPQLDRRVKILLRRHAPLQRLNGLKQVRDQQQIDDEARRVFADDDGLAQALAEGFSGLERLFAGEKRAHHLQQRHHRHRLHEVKAEPPIGPLGGSRHVGHSKS